MLPLERFTAAVRGVEILKADLWFPPSSIPHNQRHMGMSNVFNGQLNLCGRCQAIFEPPPPRFFSICFCYLKARAGGLFESSCIPCIAYLLVCVYQIIRKTSLLFPMIRILASKFMLLCIQKHAEARRVCLSWCCWHDGYTRSSTVDQWVATWVHYLGSFYLWGRNQRKFQPIEIFWNLFVQVTQGSILTTRPTLTSWA